MSMVRLAAAAALAVSVALPAAAQGIPKAQSPEEVGFLASRLKRKVAIPGNSCQKCGVLRMWSPINRFSQSGSARSIACRVSASLAFSEGSRPRRR